VTSAAAEVQRRLWGRDPRTWADLAEAHNLPLFEAVLDAAGAGPGTALLDVACGSGLALSLAAARGATVSGVDISPGLLAIARERVPDADLREEEMEAISFADDTFDAVIAVNAVQFAGDPVVALAELARVCRPDGRVVVALFAAPQRSQATAVHEAMASLAPPATAEDHAPFALSSPDNLEIALQRAGLALDGDGEVACDWRYRNLDDALAGALCSAGGARAADHAGADAVRAALTPALRTFADPVSGEISMSAVFRWTVAHPS
jgi:SAM-dependent methyltransferase